MAENACIKSCRTKHDNNITITANSMIFSSSFTGVVCIKVSEKSGTIGSNNFGITIDITNNNIEPVKTLDMSSFFGIIT
jgi:hypothetical protein